MLTHVSDAALAELVASYQRWRYMADVDPEDIQAVTFDPHPADAEQRRIWFLGRHVGYCRTHEGGPVHFLNDWSGTVQERLDVIQAVAETYGEPGCERLIRELKALDTAGVRKWESLAEKLERMESKASASGKSSPSTTKKSELWLPSEGPST